jgi:acetyl esterase/lipase
MTHLTRINLKRKILLPRPKTSSYDRPITAYLFFAGPEEDLCKATELIFDLPGGGFVAMTPEHHEERLRAWAISTKRPVLSLDYGKSPECQAFPSFILHGTLNCPIDPYPFAVDEAFDAYRLIVESRKSQDSLIIIIFLNEV